MNFKKLPRLLGLGALSLGMGLAGGEAFRAASLQAQDIQQPGEETKMKEHGVVKSHLKNDHGDVDGLLLENGVRIHFPPHKGEEIVAAVDVGDTVDVEGRQETTPRGERVFEITRLTRGKETIEIDHPRPRSEPKGRRDEQPMKASGKVVRFARNPHDDVDGLVLKDGTVVKFPPHQSSELQDLVAIGDTVNVDGRRHVTPKGDVHLHADTLEANGRTIERDGPKHGPKDRRPPHDAAEQDGPTNAELLRELKAIRQLLEKLPRS